MARIPAIDREHPSELCVSLRHFAQPFRLLDLPPEIRVRIYEKVVTCADQHLDIDSDEDPGGQLRLPDLIRTSSLVRRESMPVVLARTTTVISSPRHYCYTGPTFDAVHGLVKRLPSTYIALLRLVRLSLDNADSDWPYKVSMSWSPDSGVTIEADAISKRADPKFYRRLQSHITSVNKTCETMQTMGGHALVLAMVCRPAMWRDMKFRKS